MEYNVNKEFITIGDIIFDSCQEQPVDLDFSLPDYCPDVQKILKCQIIPGINSKNISGDRIDIDGATRIKLFYIDSVRMGVRCCEKVLPFSCSFNVGSNSQNGILSVETKVEYVNCRAISPRRIDIHGAFSVCVKVTGKETYEIGSFILDEGIEQKKESLKVNNIVELGQQQFTLEDIIELSHPDIPIESIIRSSVVVTMNDYKSIPGKLSVKGEALVRLLYMNDMDNAELQTLETVIPINQLVDIEGIDEDCICDVKLELLNYDIKADLDASRSEENTSIIVNMKLVMTVVAYSENEMEVLTDAYSNKYETDTEYKQVKLPHFIERINDVYVDKNSIEMGDKGVSNVIDIWSDISSINTNISDESLEFSGKINVCVLAQDLESNPFYIERMIDFVHEHQLTQKHSEINCQACVDVLSMGYRMSSDNCLEVRSEIKVSCPIYSMDQCRFINNISTDEDRPRENNPGTALLIYYADKGESIWDIAHSYCSCVKMIKEENDIELDSLQKRQMLLIPISK